MNINSEEYLKLISLHAEADYPKECCGLILSIPHDNTFGRTIRVKNIQDEMHQIDPDRYPRRSNQAYFMDPEALLTIHAEMRASGERIRIIYHSHIDSPPTFSAEDKRMALWGDASPVYPGVLYLVVSVIKGKADRHGLYAWDVTQKDFILAPSCFES